MNSTINAVSLNELTSTGSVALWIGVIIHFFSSIGYLFTSKYAKKEEVFYLYLNIIISSMASTFYLLMALRQCDYITSDGKLIFWGRYAEFLIGTPLLLIDLGLFMGIEISKIFYICGMDIMMIITGWFAVTSSDVISKWIFFIVSFLFYVPIIETLIVSLTINNNTNIDTTTNTPTNKNKIVAAYTLIIWTIYPIVWVLHDGFLIISFDTECILHTLIDILAKDLFGVILLYNHQINTASVYPLQPISQNEDVNTLFPTITNEYYSREYTSPGNSSKTQIGEPNRSVSNLNINNKYRFIRPLSRKNTRRLIPINRNQSTNNIISNQNETIIPIMSTIPNNSNNPNNTNNPNKESYISKIYNKLNIFRI